MTNPWSHLYVVAFDQDVAIDMYGSVSSSRWSNLDSKVLWRFEYYIFLSKTVYGIISDLVETSMQTLDLGIVKKLTGGDLFHPACDKFLGYILRILGFHGCDHHVFYHECILDDPFCR